MTWSLFRWVWQLEGSLHVGMPPAGSLNRTRLYVPARALWGALTAELSRREALNGKDPQYQAVGVSLQKDYRFTYLYPAEKVEARWQAWLPTYRDALGLSWVREDQPEQAVGDRQFRRRLLSTRPGTSIDAGTDAAADGSLRETECIEARWRDDRGRDADLVAMVGYVFVNIGIEKKAKYAKTKLRLDGLDTLFVGGDTRYGLGRLHRVSFERIVPEIVFGAFVSFDGLSPPRIESETAYGHACTDASLAGAQELLVGWDVGAIRSVESSAPAWQPGSTAAGKLRWSIGPNGLWRPS